MYTIRINFEQPDQNAVLLKKVSSGQNLLEVCLNHHIALHHLCGAACTCSTCHLYINKGACFLEEPGRRELDFLKKVKQLRPESRLGCQCVLQKGKGTLEITLPDQTKPLLK